MDFEIKQSVELDDQRGHQVQPPSIFVASLATKLMQRSDHSLFKENVNINVMNSGHSSMPVS